MKFTEQDKAESGNTGLNKTKRIASNNLHNNRLTLIQTKSTLKSCSRVLFYFKIDFLL